MISLFDECILERLLLKCEIVLKSIPSSGTRVNPEWVEEL